MPRSSAARCPRSCRGSTGASPTCGTPPSSSSRCRNGARRCCPRNRHLPPRPGRTSRSRPPRDLSSAAKRPRGANPAQRTSSRASSCRRAPRRPPWRWPAGGCGRSMRGRASTPACPRWRPWSARRRRPSCAGRWATMDGRSARPRAGTAASSARSRTCGSRLPPSAPTRRTPRPSASWRRTGAWSSRPQPACRLPGGSRRRPRQGAPSCAPGAAWAVGDGATAASGRGSAGDSRRRRGRSCCWRRSSSSPSWAGRRSPRSSRTTPRPASPSSSPRRSATSRRPTPWTQAGQRRAALTRARGILLEARALDGGGGPRRPAAATDHPRTRRPRRGGGSGRYPRHRRPARLRRGADHRAPARRQRPRTPMSSTRVARRSSRSASPPAGRSPSTASARRRRWRRRPLPSRTSPGPAAPPF